MRRPAHSGLLLCILAIWMQLFAPAAVEAMQGRAADPFSVICHHSDGGSDQQPGQHEHGGSHHCCLLCQCHMLGSLLPDGRPVFTTFDYPVASPLRWAPVVEPFAADPGGTRPPPRGPPVLV